MATTAGASLKYSSVTVVELYRVILSGQKRAISLVQVLAEAQKSSSRSDGAPQQTYGPLEMR